MYVMSNFIVVDKKEKIRTTTNRLTINFSHRTTVISVSHPSFPLEAFSFKPIPELLAAEKLDDSLLIDVIGEVVGKEDPREFITSKGKETKRLDVLIEDIENKNIGCMLFGDMVDQILPYLKEERVEPLIVIAQCFKPSRWNEEVRVFRDRRHSGKPANSARISQVSSHGLRSGAEELRKGDAIEGPVWIVGTIISINSGKDD
ncbi:hypothetical protein Ahy_B05g078162 [Arachis hypogaea]|uniref:DUF223 domain-containing protein n=1 Tax=Arachis hypogaea TaxID=3818 RepID=A0A444Z6G7_ARAHY|nr:hypothetical protein Ahy_B05g078162 [Arachis hypogaea]